MAIKGDDDIAFLRQVLTKIASNIDVSHPSFGLTYDERILVEALRLRATIERSEEEARISRQRLSVLEGGTAGEVRMMESRSDDIPTIDNWLRSQGATQRLITCFNLRFSSREKLLLDLVTTDRTEIERIRGLGKTLLAELKELLAGDGLYIGMTWADAEAAYRRNTKRD